ncbi:hypothetical protein D6D03_10329 [Aureobasidium pullulans]|nr:hypothetical protein D6D03_10329 [Aureobasidium pullulans]
MRQLHQSPFCSRQLRCTRNVTAAILILFLILYHIPDRTWRGANLLVFGAHWERFPRLNGYYAGLSNLVPISQHVEEGVQDLWSKTANTDLLSEDDIRTRMIAYNPYLHNNTRRCFLDDKGTVDIPALYSYQGIPQYHPEPLHGSYDALGLRDDICFDRYGRLGAYGLDENATIQEHHSPDETITSTPHSKSINWQSIDWSAAQHRCHGTNKHQFVQTPDSGGHRSTPRQALVLRTWTGYHYTPHVMMNIRALISELSLGSGAEYDVHLLVHVKNNSAQFWESQDLYREILHANIPKEFRGLATLWSESQMEMVYPGPFLNNTLNKSGKSIHGVYRSSHMPLQCFAQNNAQYEHFWNWEMDMRYTGHYYELLDRLGHWANAQPRHGLWERSAKYYLEKMHGTWKQFSDLVHQENPNTIFGPVKFPGSQALKFQRASWLSSSVEDDKDADLITLSPLFDPNESGWYFDTDITGYPSDSPLPPRRVAIIAASRMSRGLLHLMHEETLQYRRSMWTEMWAPSIALHYGLKAVYAPHPVYYDRKWPVSTADKIFNAGKHGSSGGNAFSVFGAFEHNHLGSTWYHNARFAGELWRSWLGRGSRHGMFSQQGVDRMCLRSMLLHTVKYE